MSDAKASACRSNISLTCSSNESGTPIGAPGSSRGSPLRVVRLDALDAPLDLADVLEIVGRAARDRRRRASLFSRATCAVIQSRMLLSSARRCRALLRRGADAEQLVERRARVADHRQRRRRRGPADRVGVDAGVAVGAAAGLIDVLDAQLHRRNRRVLAELLRVELVERGADAHVRALRLLRMRLRQEHGARAEVVAADLRRRRTPRRCARRCC